MGKSSIKAINALLRPVFHYCYGTHTLSFKANTSSTYTSHIYCFPLERCAKSGKECEGWKDEIDGKKLAVNNEADHALGGMTTLNNVCVSCGTVTACKLSLTRLVYG